MAKSRKRPGNHLHHTPYAISSNQRTKGRLLWALLCAVFGLLIAFFAAGTNYIALMAGVIIGSVLGYVIEKVMEKEAVGK